METARVWVMDSVKVAFRFAKRPEELTADRRQGTAGTKGQQSPKDWQLIATTVRSWSFYLLFHRPEGPVLVFAAPSALPVRP